MQRTPSIRPGRISLIFVMHCHSDHSFGLSGLLCLMGTNRMGDDPPVEIYGQKESCQLKSKDIPIMHFEITFQIMMLIFVVRMISKLPRPTIHPAQNPTCPIAVHHRDPTSMQQQAWGQYHHHDRFPANHSASTTNQQMHWLPAQHFCRARNCPMPPPPPARLYFPHRTLCM
jgi:ribonuclease BN (tRNA processing enzyme)